MNEPMTYLLVAGTVLVAMGITIAALLKAWNGWLALKRLELGAAQARSAPVGDRIELADLRERVRKLEAIAACVDL